MQIKTLLLAVATLATTATAFAQQMKPEDAIKTRKAGYTFMAWNMGKIKANVEGKEFNKDQVAAAARAIAGIAGSGMGALYLPGTEKDVGDQKTRVKPEFFDPKNREELGKIAVNFMQQAGKLAEVAAGGDKAAVATQFGELGKACKACHDKFRKE